MLCQKMLRPQISQRKLLHIAPKLLNLQQFSSSKVSPCTVLQKVRSSELGNEAEVVQPHPRTILRLAKLTTLNDDEMSLALNPNLLLPCIRAASSKCWSYIALLPDNFGKLEKKLQYAFPSSHNFICGSKNCPLQSNSIYLNSAIVDALVPSPSYCNQNYCKCAAYK